MCCNNNWFGAAARSASSCGCGMTASIGYVPVRVYTGSTANNGRAHRLWLRKHSKHKLWLWL